MNNRPMGKKTMWGLGCMLAVFLSCSKTGGGNVTTPPPAGSDPVLVNLGTNIIIPAYEALDGKLTALDAAVTAFNAAPAAGSLSAAQEAFKAAYLGWAGASAFEFGPAADQFLTTHFVNSFPTDTAIIRSNEGGATYAIDGIGNFAAQGFPALDYLLFAGGAPAVMARFTTSATATGARAYLAALTRSLKTKADAVVQAWTSYQPSFLKATGADAGSSLSLLVNAYVFDFDVNLQNFKLGIPIGIYGPNTLPKSPAKLEGFYGCLSDQLLVAQAKNCLLVYSGGTGPGLLAKVAATNVGDNGVPLSAAISTQLTTLIAALQTLPQPLSAGITNDDPVITAAFTEVRKTTVILKSDMSSALGIKISFADDDGD